MTSLAPSNCCYQGVKHEGEARGEISRIGDFEVYIVKPEREQEQDQESYEKAILILTDVIGHKFINVQLIADQFAANGYLVLVPDLFVGDPIPLNRPGDFDLPAWLKGAYHPQGTPHTPETVDPIIEASIAELRGKYGVKKIGSVGYCFGGKYVVRHLRPPKSKIDVGFIAHPSFVAEDELRGISGPLSIAAAETDQIFPVENRHKSEEILKEVGVPYQISLYSGVSHGFAVRGDVSDRVARFAKESAFLQGLGWFGEFLRD
ncbi:esterase/lipase [Aspergillus karnatakaensis]|uniref:esterase/lipase n=1 Tax=Aspergillus karnatakaensis TaxID=1810916 RepID=UPI003CCD3FD5